MSQRGDHGRGVKDRSAAAPTDEQLVALVAVQERLIAQLQTRNAEQDARFAEQDARIPEQERQLGALTAEFVQAAVGRRAGQGGAEVAARSVGQQARWSARDGRDARCGRSSARMPWWPTSRPPALAAASICRPTPIRYARQGPRRRGRRAARFTGTALRDAFAPTPATTPRCTRRAMQRPPAARADRRGAVVDHHNAHTPGAEAASPPTGAGLSRSSTRCGNTRRSPTPASSRNGMGCRIFRGVATPIISGAGDGHPHVVADVQPGHSIGGVQSGSGTAAGLARLPCRHRAAGVLGQK